MDVRVATAIVAGTVLGALALAPVAAAQESEFGCRATGLRVGSLELSVANPQGVPCQDDSTSLRDFDIKVPPLTGSLLRVQASGLQANTDAEDPELDFPAGANARTAVIRIEVLGHSIAATLLSSNIRGFIGPMGCEWVGDGLVFVDNLEIDGEVVPIPGNELLPGGPMPFPGLPLSIGPATLHVPWGNGQGTVRGLFLDGPGNLDVVVAESVATCPPEDEA